jgi:multiple sugar transport system ATP-binding protein
VIGLRPEHIHVVAGDAASPLAIPARVTLVETLGAETLLHADAEGGTVVARLHGRAHGVTDGDAITLHADLARLHRFDAAGQRMPVALPLAAEAHNPR